jgi:hypothetical protein
MVAILRSQIANVKHSVGPSLDQTEVHIRGVRPYDTEWNLGV